MAVQGRRSGTVVGEVMLLRQSDDEAVLGHALRRDRWGRGLATEAARTVLEAGIDSFGLRRTTAVVVPANAASIAVLGKLGFVEVARSPERVTFAHAVDRWEQLTGADGPGACSRCSRLPTCASSSSAAGPR